MQAAWINVLESGTVTVTGEAQGYPAYRLYDRLFARPWRAVGTGTQTIQVDQGAAPVAVDCLIVPLGHLLDGCTLAFERSPNGSDWTPLVTAWVQSGSDTILKQAAAPTTDRYLRVVISGASVAPEIGELLITRLHTFTGPDFGATRSREPRAVRLQGIGGPPRFAILDVGATVLGYRFELVPEAERALYEAWFDDWADRQRPFYCGDDGAVGAFYEFAQPPRMTRISVGLSSIEMELRQVY